MNDETEYEYWDDDRWEYEEEALQAQLERESAERFKRQPVICQKCRWFDWYYLEDCNMRRVPVNGKCSYHCRDYSFVYRLPAPLKYWWWDWQHRLWAFKLKLLGLKP